MLLYRSLSNVYAVVGSLARAPLALCSLELLTSSVRGKKKRENNEPNSARFCRLFGRSAAAAVPSAPPVAELRGRERRKRAEFGLNLPSVWPLSRGRRGRCTSSSPRWAPLRERETGRIRAKSAACSAAPPRPLYLRLPWWAGLRERSYADADAMLPPSTASL
ncbi:hypothetical protein NDU88_007906, partial [Pleurodeles waltl]